MRVPVYLCVCLCLYVCVRVLVCMCLQGWAVVQRDSNGIQILRHTGEEKSQIHMFRSMTVAPIAIDLDAGFAESLLLDTSEKFRAQFKEFDPTFLDGQVGARHSDRVPVRVCCSVAVCACVCRCVCVCMLVRVCARPCGCVLACMCCFLMRVCAGPVCTPRVGPPHVCCRGRE